MFTLTAFYSSVANGATNTALSAATDQSMTPDFGGRLQVPGDWKILAAHALVPNGTAARINAPSLRFPFLPAIQPITVGTTVASGDGPVKHWSRPFALRQGEGYQPEVSRAGGAAGDCYAGLWVGPNTTTARPGKAFTMLATSTVTTVKGAWVLGALTLDQTLPAGAYAVVGMAAQWAGALYARLVYPGASGPSAQFRPGVMGQVTYGDRPWDQDWRLGMGMDFGSFVFNAPPQIEVFSTAAASVTVTSWFDLVQVG